MMLRQHRHDPRYGFDRHKGYATADHREALLRFGPSAFHRRSFAPVQAAPETPETPMAELSGLEHDEFRSKRRFGLNT